MHIQRDPFSPESESHDARRRWHIKREVDLSSLLVLISLLAGFFVYALHQENRMTTTENEVKQEHDTNVRQDQERQRQWEEIRSDLKALNEKTDRILETRK